VQLILHPFFFQLRVLFAASNGPEALFYIADHSKARVIVVEDDIQLQKVLSVKHKLPNLSAIVQYTGDVSASGKAAGVYSWQSFLALASNVSPPALAAREAAQKAGRFNPRSLLSIIACLVISFPSFLTLPGSVHARFCQSLLTLPLLPNTLSSFSSLLTSPYQAMCAR
jgi:hypothetical protein